MAWQYRLVEAGHVPQVIPDIRSHLNGLNKKELVAAKVVLADAREDNARSVIFWNRDIEYSNIPDLPGQNWSFETFTTIDDFQGLYKQVTTKLDQLSPSQAFYAKVVASDAMYNPAYIVVFWPG